MKNLAIRFLVHAGVGEKELGRTALRDRRKHLRAEQILARLCGQDHGGVALTPGFQRFQDVKADDGIPEKTPSLIDEEGFKGRGIGRVLNGSAGTVQDVEKKRLQEFRDLFHALEIKGLEPREG